MNKDKTALRHMIKAALQCPEFIEGHGDGKYLFSNMVAKYTLSDTTYRFTQGALEEFIQRGGDVNKVHTRASLYGKNSPFIYEHSIPAKVVRDQLIQNPDQVDTILDNVGEVFITLRTEDDILRSKGYQSTMSEGWEFGDSHLDRYDTCGIKVSDQLLNMKGAIKR
jgi:hypothetical protein